MCVLPVCPVCACVAAYVCLWMCTACLGSIDTSSWTSLPPIRSSRTFDSQRLRVCCCCMHASMRVPPRTTECRCMRISVCVFDYTCVLCGTRVYIWSLYTCIGHQCSHITAHTAAPQRAQRQQTSHWHNTSCSMRTAHSAPLNPTVQATPPITTHQSQRCHEPCA